MNLRHIEVFHALMHSSNITDAARRLNVSQPSISTVLKHAESRLGMQLFKRVGGRLHPTPEALALFPDVEEIFTRLQALGRSARGLRNAASGSISIAASPTLTNVLLPRVVAAFREERPDVHVLLDALSTRQVVKRVRERACDLGLIYEPSDAVPDDFDVRAVGSVRIACVVPNDHALAKKEEVKPTDLQGFPLVTFGDEAPLGARLKRAFEEEGVPFDVAVETTSSSTSLFLAAAGVGVALVDAAGAIEGTFPNLVVRSFVPLIETRVVLINPRDRPCSRLATAFADKLTKALKPPTPSTARRRA